MVENVVYRIIDVHIVPGALTSPGVISIKDERCVITLGLHRSYKRTFLKNWPSSLKNPIFGTLAH